MNNKSLQLIGFIYAAIFLSVLLIEHVAVLLNISPPWEISFVVAFFIMLPMWAFMIFFMNKTIEIKDEDAQNLSTSNKYKMIMGNPPQWLFILTCAVYVYGFFRAFVWLSGGMIEPYLSDGQYQYRSHGQTTYYTLAEYQLIQKQSLLGVTGGMLIFASFAFAVFFPKKGSLE